MKNNLLILVICVDQPVSKVHFDKVFQVLCSNLQHVLFATELNRWKHAFLDPLVNQANLDFQNYGYFRNRIKLHGSWQSWKKFRTGTILN